MALTVTVTRGYTAQEGVVISADDFNAGFLPQVSVAGSVGAIDLEDGAVTFAKLNNNLVLGGTAFSGTLAVDDKLLLGDLSAGGNAVLTVLQLLQGLLQLGSAVTEFGGFTTDTFTFRQASDGTAKTITPAILAEQLIQQAPVITVTGATDKVLVWSSGAVEGSKAKAVTLDNFLPVIGTAQTVANPTSIQIDDKGRVLTVSSSGTGTRTSSVVEATETALPTAAGYANAAVVPHGLGAKPMIVVAWLKCTDAGGNAGWVLNDEVEFSAVSFDAGASDHNPHYQLVADANHVRLVRPAIGSGTDGIIPNKTTGADDVFTPSKWKLRIAAVR